jgi:predicted Zn-dependent protease with MMP-like domain
VALSGPDWREAAAPSPEDFDALVETAFAALPDWVREGARGVLVRVEDFAPQEVLDDMGVEDPFELTGLYEGVALTEKSVDDLPGPPDTVRLFRRPILEEWIDRGDVGLGALVAHVLVHELAHHFGWSDADIAAVDPWWE